MTSLSFAPPGFVGSIQAPCSRSRASESVQRCYASSKKKERNEKKTGGFGRWSCLRPAAFGTWEAPSRPRRSRPDSSPPKTASSRRSRGAGLSNLPDRTPIESLLPTRARAMNVTAKLQSEVCLRRGTYHIPSSPPTCSPRIAQGLRLPFILGTSLFWSCGVPLPYRSANNKPCLIWLVDADNLAPCRMSQPAIQPGRTTSCFRGTLFYLLLSAESASCGCVGRSRSTEETERSQIRHSMFMSHPKFPLTRETQKKGTC